MQPNLATQPTLPTQITFDFPDAIPAQPLPPTKTQELAHAWMAYARINKLNPKTKGYRWAQHAFLTGIGNVMGEQMPPILSICLISGRDIASVIERTQAR